MYLEKINSEFKKILCRISPKLLSKYCYYLVFKEKLDLDHPKKFNEKLMWLKLNKYMNDPIIWKCADKYLLREYVKEKGISKENLSELIGIYDSVDEIDFNKLPNRFALKCSHGCGFNIICEDKNKLDIKDTKDKLNKWLNTKFGYETAELQYIHQKPRLICEKFIDSNKGLPYDYKIYCFYGEPKLVLVCSERKKNLCLNFFDLDWNEIFIGKDKYRNTNTIERPSQLKNMIEISKKVSNDFPFVRVDFYEYNNKAILGELTFTPAACLATYYDEDKDQYLSDMLRIEK